MGRQICLNNSRQGIRCFILSSSTPNCDTLLNHSLFSVQCIFVYCYFSVLLWQIFWNVCLHCKIWWWFWCFEMEGSWEDFNYVNYCSYISLASHFHDPDIRVVPNGQRHKPTQRLQNHDERPRQTQENTKTTW